jgi:hypothetical protein
MPTFPTKIHLVLAPSTAELPKFLSDSSTLYPPDSMGNVTLNYGAAVAPAQGLTLTDDGSVVLSYTEFPAFLAQLFTDVPEDAFRGVTVQIGEVPDPAAPPAPAPAPAPGNTASGA